MHLEAGRVQRGHVVAQGSRVDEAEALVAGRAATAVEIAVEQAGGEVLDDAVLHDLHRRRPETHLASRRAPLDQVTELLRTAGPVPPQGPHHPRDELAGLLGPHVDGQGVGLPEQRADRRVLPGGDAVGEHHLLRLQQAGELLVGGGHRCQAFDQRGRPLVQGALRCARRVTLDPSVGWVGCRRVETGELEGSRVGPRAVAVGVAQDRRAVADHGVERLAGRRAVREVGHRPPGAEDPRQVGMGRGIVRDACQCLLRRRRVVEVAAQQVDTGSERVRVRVLEARRDQPARDINHVGTLRRPPRVRRHRFR